MEKLKNLSSYFEKNKIKTEEWELGVDEAGRGPVLGPMVYGCTFWPVSLKKFMAEIGFADSKTLDEEQREDYFKIINELKDKYLGYEVRVLDPEYISNKMLQKYKVSLNEISHEAAMELIQRVLDQGINLVHCYLDTVGPPTGYTALLETRFSDRYPNIKFTVSEKADSKFAVVSAASICAKVTRDQSLKNWKFREQLDNIDMDFGGGYPGNDKTVQWLKNNMDPVFGFPDLVRFSWKTCETLMADKIKVKFENEAEQNPKIQRIDKLVAKEKRGFYLSKLEVTNDFSL